MARVSRETHSHRTGAVWFALACVYVIWSTTYLAIRVTDQTLPPLVAAGIRFLIAGSVLYVVAIRRGDRIGDRPGRSQWRAAAIVGVLLMGCGNGGVVWAETRIPSGIAALIFATLPLWLVILDRLVFRRRHPRAVTAGVVLGLAGTAVLVGGSAMGGQIDLLGMLVVVAGTFCWACGSLYQRQAVLPHRPLVAAAMEMIIGGAALIVGGAITGELADVDPSRFSRASLIALAYLIVFGSWVGFTSYLWLLRNARTSLVSTYAYVTPAGAVFLGWLILGESIGARTIVAGAVILIAVALIVKAGGVAREVEPGSDAREDRGPEVETQVGLERSGGAEEQGFAEGGRGELQADGEPA
jgi:drug/metabolite transporter (DMT)-like permease